MAEDYLVLYWSNATPGNLVPSTDNFTACQPALGLDDKLLNNFNTVKASTSYYSYRAEVDEILSVRCGTNQPSLLVNFVFTLPEVPLFPESEVSVGIITYDYARFCAALAPLKFTRTFNSCGTGCSYLQAYSTLTLTDYVSNPYVAPAPSVAGY